jgi:flavin reductase (DIM6/NTAB) family NADH-FMN oxidoreductase RutF
MPEDMNGAPLLEGDRVMVPCRVVEVLPGPDFCNVTVQVELPCYPDDHRTRVWLNSRQCERRAETVQDAHPKGGDRERAQAAFDAVMRTLTE